MENWEKNGITYRPALAEDYEGVVAIWDLDFVQHNYMSYIQNPLIFPFVAVEKKKIVSGNFITFVILLFLFVNYTIWCSQFSKQIRLFCC